jgi:lysophospholipase L1-like esterase
MTNSFRIPRILLLAWLALVPFSLSAVEPQGNFANQIRNLIARDTSAPPPRHAVVCVGSSSMRMWKDRMAADLAPITVIPRGFGGSQFSDVIEDFELLIAQYSPRAVVVYEGDNDIGMGKSPAEVFRDFATLRAQIDAFDPTIRLYVIGVKPSLARGDKWAWMQQFNREVAALATVDDRLTFIDVGAALMGENGRPVEDWFIEDGLHLNQTGYDHWAAAIASVLVPAELPFESTVTPVSPVE